MRSLAPLTRIAVPVVFGLAALQGALLGKEPTSAAADSARLQTTPIRASQPWHPATHPATVPASSATTTAIAWIIDPNARIILDALEKAGEKYRTVLADVDHLVELREVGDTEARTGSVAYQKGGDPNESAKFKIQFDTLSLGGAKPTAEKVEYAFDGMWMTAAKHRIRQITRYQVAAKGEKVEPLRIGKGPFPLPFGQKAEDVLKFFLVTTRPTKDKEPSDSDYLKLTARPERSKEVNFKTLEMWVDRKTGLPVKLISIDPKNTTTVDFKNVQTNKEITPDTFIIPKPPGWELIIKRLGED